MFTMSSVTEFVSDMYLPSAFEELIFLAKSRTCTDIWRDNEVELLLPVTHDFKVTKVSNNRTQIQRNTGSG